MTNQLTFIDVFAGAGGLSEGFVQEGFQPVAHVEADVAACNTLRTRMAFHWLGNVDRLDLYCDYLWGQMSREELYASVPTHVTGSVINDELKVGNMRRIYRKIDELLGGRRLDVLVGGPPCQGFSVPGRARRSKESIVDKRNDLYKCYVRFLARYRPKCFLFENVIGLLSAKDSNGDGYVDTITQHFRRLGYETKLKVLCANDYGVLQRRKRVIIVGYPREIKSTFPEPENWYPNVEVNEIFDNLPPLHAGEGEVEPCSLLTKKSVWQVRAGVKSDMPVTWHQARPNTARDLEIYRIAVKEWNNDRKRLHYDTLPARLKTHRNAKSFTDRFKVVAADLPFSQTVVAHISKDGHYYIHPDIEQNRSITPREAARLQTFPDDYYFESANLASSRTHAFRQIGNAVPVLLSRRIAAKLREQIHG